MSDQVTLWTIVGDGPPIPDGAIKPASRSEVIEALGIDYEAAWMQHLLASTSGRLVSETLSTLLLAWRTTNE